MSYSRYLVPTISKYMLNIVGTYWYFVFCHYGLQIPTRTSDYLWCFMTLLVYLLITISLFQGMGESNCLLSQPTLRRDVLTGAAAIYHDLYASSEDSTLPLTFNILYFIAWKRSTVQGVPRPRGSQTASIADLDKIINSKPGGTGSKS